MPELVLRDAPYNVFAGMIAECRARSGDGVGNGHQLFVTFESGAQVRPCWRYRGEECRRNAGEFFHVGGKEFQNDSLVPIAGCRLAAGGTRRQR
jgi:hypothetical protein